MGFKSVKEKAYFTLVRPTLEYESPVWDPHTAKNMNKIEAVQRRAATWVINGHHQTSSVDDMYQQLQWSPLTERRRRARLTTFVKYHHREVVINTTEKPIPNPASRSTRQSHTASY